MSFEPQKKYLYFEPEVILLFWQTLRRLSDLKAFTDHREWNQAWPTSKDRHTHLLRFTQEKHARDLHTTLLTIIYVKKDKVELKRVLTKWQEGWTKCLAGQHTPVNSIIPVGEGTREELFGARHGDGHRLGLAQHRPANQVDGHQGGQRGQPLKQNFIRQVDFLSAVENYRYSETEKFKERCGHIHSP